MWLHVWSTLSVSLWEASSPCWLQVTSLGLTFYNPFHLKNTKCIQHFSSSHVAKIPPVKDKLKLRHIICSQFYARSQRNKNELTCKVRPILQSSGNWKGERTPTLRALVWNGQAVGSTVSTQKQSTRLKWGKKQTKKTPPKNPQKQLIMDTMHQYLPNASYWKKLEKIKHCLQTFQL